MNSNKTVIIIEDSSKANMGGGQQISKNVAKLLSQNNDIDFIFTDYTSVSRYAKLVQKLFVNSKFIGLKSAIIKSTKTPKIVNRAFEVATLKFYFKSNFNKIVKSLPKANRNTICYVASKKGLTLAYKLKQTYGIEYVFHAHLVENSDSVQFRAMKKYMEAAKTIICVSKAVLESYNRPTNAIFQYNSQPCPTDKFVMKTDSQYVVAFIGGLIAIKGIEYFIDAAKRDNRDNVKYRIYGEGILRAELENRADGKVQFMGYAYNVIKELREDIDVLVLPTIISEALPGVIIEAKTVGVPTITTNIGGQAEIVENEKSGLLVPIKNSESIYQAVVKITSNLSYYNLLAEAALDSSHIFSIEEFNNTIKKEIM